LIRRHPTGEIAPIGLHRPRAKPNRRIDLLNALVGRRSLPPARFIVITEAVIRSVVA